MNSNRNILTIDECANAIGVEPDFNKDLLLQYSKTATALVESATGYTWDGTNELPYQVHCLARMYVLKQHYLTDEYDKTIDSLCAYVQNLVMESQNEKNV